MISGDLEAKLAHVLWLGGGPDAGKTSVARILTRRHGLGFYSLDKQGQVHLGQLAAGAAADPATYRQVLASSPAERLVELEPFEHVAWAWTFARDRFPLLLEDLRGFSGPTPILVEGVTLLPELIKPLLTTLRQAIWLIPTESFIQANWSRSKKRFLARRTTDPDQARRNLLAIDQLLSERIAGQARADGLRLLEIDGSHSPAEVADMVADHFAPHL